MDIKYRDIRDEDGYEWYTLLDSVWRVAYGHILPAKVFDARDEHRQERAAGFTKEKFVGDRKIAMPSASMRASVPSSGAGKRGRSVVPVVKASYPPPAGGACRATP